jgi:pSer/pThr/pTyr-binding forkhead associated (FHA) protein
MSTGTKTLGSAETNDIVIQKGDLEPSHASLTLDHRGITLTINALDAETRVNNRPVVEKAILRLGDVLTLNGLTLVLKQEPEQLIPLSSADPDSPAPTSDDADGIPPRYYLRGVEGQHSGRLFPISNSVSLGPAESSDIDVEAAVSDGKAATQVLFNPDHHIEFRHGPEGVVINGHALKDARLNPGDQIVLGNDRFMLESPTFVPGRAFGGVSNVGVSSTQVFKAPVADELSQAAHEASQTDKQTVPGRRRDQIIITSCIILSAMMLIWLFINL